MPEERSELDKFLEGIPQDAPKLDESIQREETEQKEEEESEPKLNRQARRQQENAGIRKQLQEEREARIAAEARMQAIAELKSAGETNSDLHKVLFGSQAETPESRLVTENLQKILSQTKESAVNEAYERIQRERAEATREEQEAQNFIDEQLSYLEEETGIDLTSNTAVARKNRTEFLDMVEKLSPKDNEGNIREYADFGAAFEMYQSTKKGTSPRRTEIASRSMAKSGEPQLKQEEEDKTRGYLRSIGLKV